MSDLANGFEARFAQRTEVCDFGPIADACSMESMHAAIETGDWRSLGPREAEIFETDRTGVCVWIGVRPSCSGGGGCGGWRS